METIKLTKEEILVAYDKACEEGKKVLRSLFPEIFKSKYFDLSKLKLINKRSEPLIHFFTLESAVNAGFHTQHFIAIRLGDKYENKAFFLSNVYNWELKEDDDGILCLIPTKK